MFELVSDGLDRFEYPPGYHSLEESFTDTVDCVKTVADAEDPSFRIAITWLFRILPSLSIAEAIFNFLIIIVVRYFQIFSASATILIPERRLIVSKTPCTNLLFNCGPRFFWNSWSVGIYMQNSHAFRIINEK